MNEKSIIYRLIFEKGCPAWVIAKKLNVSEAEIYRFLNGEKVPRRTDAELKRLWLDLTENKGLKNAQSDYRSFRYLI